MAGATDRSVIGSDQLIGTLVKVGSASATCTTQGEELGRPCTEAAVEHALACAARRIAAHDDERA
ncbi:MAG TPA: hypothetical protein VMF65_03340 [Acidimicrobiales bacterium]|nr:hypothetical protein [Acidimicrobiales bacterium]